MNVHVSYPLDTFFVVGMTLFIGKARDYVPNLEIDQDVDLTENKGLIEFKNCTDSQLEKLKAAAKDYLDHLTSKYNKSKA